MIFEKLKYSWNMRKYQNSLDDCRHYSKDILEGVKTREKALTPFIKDAMKPLIIQSFSRLVYSARKADKAGKKLGKSGGLELDITRFWSKYNCCYENTASPSNVPGFIEEFEQYVQDLKIK